MPGMNGVDVYQRLKADASTHSIPVILLTAKVLPSDRAKFAQMGVMGMLSKPIEPNTLVMEVAELLGWED
jgi:CheY-like chemotaxis protein